jgi:DNA-binding MarR family transcriptional regulator
MRQSVDFINEMDSAALPAEDVVEALHQTMRALRASHHRGGEGELTHMDGRVLSYFAHHPGSTQKALAQHSGRDKGQLARLVQGLRARGLLAATPDPADRRALCIALTPAGQAEVDALHAHGRRQAARAAQTLSAQERRQLVDLLARLRTQLGAAP